MNRKLEYCDVCDEYVEVTHEGELACGHYEDQLIRDEHYLEELDFHE